MTLFTIAQAREWLNEHTVGKSWSLARVYAAAKAGELPATKIAGRIVVVDLEAWLERQADKATTAATRLAPQSPPADLPSDLFRDMRGKVRPRRFGAVAS